MALLDFLFEGKAPPQTTSYSSTSSNLPDWWQAYTQGLISKANAVAALPYDQYAGTKPPRVAGFTGDQTNAFQQTRNNMGAWQPTFNAGQGALTGAATPFSQSTFDQFKSPYLDGVTNRIAQLGARNLSENLVPALGDTFTKAGQFGSSRHEDFTARALRDTQEAVLGKQAETLQAGQDAAMRAYESAMGRSAAAGQQLGALAQTQQSLGLRDAAALEAVGQQQQGLNQRNLDTAFQDYVEKRDYDRNNIAFLNSAIRGLQQPTSTTTTSTGPVSSFQPSPLAQIAGAASGIGALGNAFGMGQQQPTGRARGGYMKARGRRHG